MKIKVNIPYDVANIGEVLFKENPEDIIVGLNDIMKKCKTAGYSNITISWSIGGDYPSLYGMRNETIQEKAVRLKKEAVQIAKREEKKKKEIDRAIQVLKKYKVNE